jgi:hypothetical protein
MPKLTPETLKKRHACPTCGETFRHRQGLSGHIQFKHKTQDSKESNPFMEAVYYAAGLKRRVGPMGFNTKDVEDLLQVVNDWNTFKVIFEDEHVVLNNNDYKNYLMMAFALKRANDRLSKLVISELAGGMVTGFGSLNAAILKLKAD